MTENQKMTHFNEYGRAKMVEVTEKADTHRRAIACGTVKMNPLTAEMIKQGSHKKGDVLAVAQIAGIMGAKKTSDLIPMCHPLALTGVDIYFDLRIDSVYIEATVSTFGKTGVEMEAITAVSTTALAIYDMCKAVDKDMEISGLMLLSKTGGKSGVYQRNEG